MLINYSFFMFSLLLSCAEKPETQNTIETLGSKTIEIPDTLRSILGLKSYFQRLSIPSLIINVPITLSEECGQSILIFYSPRNNKIMICGERDCP